MASVPVEKKDMSSKFPKWFEPVPGFKFRDQDGDPCVVIGWGGHRETEQVAGDAKILGRIFGSQLVFKPCALLYSYNHKGEWHISEVEILVDYTDDRPLKKGWTKEQEKTLSGWR